MHAASGSELHCLRQSNVLSKVSSIWINGDCFVIIWIMCCQLEWEIELLRNITRLHFYWSIRTAGLEQEVENLKKKLADCIKENSNIKDELSEAKRIKVRFFFCIPLRIFHCHLLVCAWRFSYLFSDIYGPTPQIGGYKGLFPLPSLVLSLQYIDMLYVPGLVSSSLLW